MARQQGGLLLFAGALLLAACSGSSASSTTQASPTATTLPTSTATPLRLLPTSSLTGAFTTTTPTPSVKAPTTTATSSILSATPQPTSCQTEHVTALVTAFLDAFNRGDQAAFARFFPPAKQRLFQYYRVVGPDETAFVARDQAALADYLAERRQQREQLQFQGLQLSASPGSSIVTAELRLTRQAANLPAHEVVVQIRVHCERGWVYAWNLRPPVALTLTLAEDYRYDPLPAGCWSTTEVAALVTRFAAAFNQGDRAAFMRFFPDKAVSNPKTMAPEEAGLFRWYAVNTLPGPNFIAYTPEQLPAYFAARQAQGERWEVRQVGVAPASANDVVLSFRLTRQAADLTSRQVDGKAWLDCANGTIYVWNMADVAR